MTEIDLFNIMKPFNHIFEGYKNKTVHHLTPDELTGMKEIYSAVQRVYPNVLPPVFVTTCPSCVIEALEQFISIYDRLSSTLADAFNSDELIENLTDVLDEPAQEPVKSKSKKK